MVAERFVPISAAVTPETSGGVPRCRRSRHFYQPVYMYLHLSS